MDGRIAIVTGGAREIGRENAKALKENGARSVIAATKTGKVININLHAIFYCCREFGKVMLEQLGVRRNPEEPRLIDDALDNKRRF